MIAGIQIIGILFGLLMMYLLYLKIKRGEFTIKESVFWSACWIIFLFVSVWPNALDLLSWKVLELSRTMDLIIILGFIFLTGISFYMYTLIRQNQKQVDAIVRNLAIKKPAHKSKGTLKEEEKED